MIMNFKKFLDFARGSGNVNLRFQVLCPQFSTLHVLSPTDKRGSHVNKYGRINHTSLVQYFSRLLAKYARALQREKKIFQILHIIYTYMSIEFYELLLVGLKLMFYNRRKRLWKKWLLIRYGLNLYYEYHIHHKMKNNISFCSVFFIWQKILSFAIVALSFYLVITV
jgi:hypothetical protein